MVPVKRTKDGQSRKPQLGVLSNPACILKRRENVERGKIRKSNAPTQMKGDGSRVYVGDARKGANRDVCQESVEPTILKPWQRLERRLRHLAAAAPLR